MPITKERKRSKSMFNPPMATRLELAGVYTSTRLTPPAPPVASNLWAPTKWGYSTWMRDLVHEEFMARNRSYKGRKPLRLRVRSSPDVGGDLTQYFVKDGSLKRGTADHRVQIFGYDFRYQGGFYPVWPSTINLVYPWSQEAIQTAGTSGLFSGETGSAANEGPTWWRRTSPKMSTADLGQAIGECRELFPMLKTSAHGFAEAYKELLGKGDPGVLSIPQKIANHWVNGQFGWRPFLKDCADAFYTYLNAEEKLKVLRYRNNRWVRRRTLVETKVLATNHDILNNGHRVSYFPSDVNVAYALGAGTSTISGVVTQKTWCVGAFKYWIPSYESPQELVEKTLNYLRVYGIMLNPLLLWNLTPWSWLADWVGNVGDNIANLSAQLDSNLVGRYAYVMRETSAVFDNTSTVVYYAMVPGYTRMTKECTWRLEYLLRTRRHAGPFGFATDWGNLNPKQWSILGALGLMRLH